MADLVGRLQIDEKHHIEVKIIKTTNDQPIPDNEPTILFRGRDKLALPMLRYYKELCEKDGATAYQLHSMDVMINKFIDFEREHGDKMKQPGVTLGK
jgi:hypothetical protein